MNAAFDTDLVVVGAGVVGLACARSAAARGRSVILLERHERFGVETSSRNSEVVHAGLYYPPGSLKARLCVRGNRSLFAWCEAHDVPHRRTGKLIVAPTPDDEPALAEVLESARENGVTSLTELSGRQARAMEPHLRTSAALWSPDTGIVDSHRLMATLLAAAEEHGVTGAWRHRLEEAEPRAGGYRLRVAAPDGERTWIVARCVVNAAGLDADTVAALPGLDVEALGYRQHYARGHYFRVHPRRSALTSRLIYPTPAAGGLGIHVTPDLAGSLRLGPDVEYLAERRQDYAVDPDLAVSFHASVARFLEGLSADDLSPDQAGIRPRLSGPGEGFRDFVIAEESAHGLPGWVNCIGIESPGLTAALEIGDMVAELLEEGPDGRR